MKTNLISIIVCLLIAPQILYAQKSKETSSSDKLKPRIVILTDVSTWETDDSESLVRLFAYADMFEIEGLIYTTGWSLDETRDDFINLIHKAVDAYEKDLPNLMKRSGQSVHSNNEIKQVVGYWPSANYLRDLIMFGSKKRGIKHIGEGNDSPGSDHIIKLADEDDDRALWICVWGGANTLAQAVWKVQNERNPEQLKTFLHKIPTYSITDQDRSYVSNTPFNISSQYWLRKNFKNDLLYLWDESAWLYQAGIGRTKWADYETHIQGHGNLGDVYPKYTYGVEGDTPSFLHVTPNGLNNPLIVDQIGWGGYFKWGISPDNETYSYNNHKDTAKKISTKYETYFYPAIFNDFAARMDWAKDGKGNRNPVVTVNGSKGNGVLTLNVKQGQTVNLDASKTFDPDGDRLSYKWWVLQEAGTYMNSIDIENAISPKAKITIPADAIGKKIHVICEVTDSGTPCLTSYRRIIFEP